MGIRFVSRCVASAALLNGLSVGALQAATDCTNPISFAEKTVCASPALREQDDKLDAAYEQLRIQVPDSKALVFSQRRWLKTVLKRCTTQACVEKAYRVRQQTLAQWLQPAPANDALVGRYAMVRNNMVFGGPEYGWKPVLAPDCLSISKQAEDQYTVDLALTQTNGHRCVLNGTFASRGDYLEYQPKPNSSHLDTEHPQCKLQLHPRTHTIELQDPDLGCQQYCGTHASFSEREFLRDQTGIHGCTFPSSASQSLQ